MMTFEEYLDSKKIDSSLFREKEHSTFAEWESSFNQMHPNGFTAQKLYLINRIRRRFPKSTEKK